MIVYSKKDIPGPAAYGNPGTSLTMPAGVYASVLVRVALLATRSCEGSVCRYMLCE